MAVSVLVIDAEEEFANQVADALRAEGIEPVITGDGKVGLDLAKINVPAAIILCVELPRMSGYSICAKLKKDTTLKNVPLIITSADATPETFEHHKKLKTRAEEYLKKPFPAQQLVAVLKQYISADQSDAEPMDFVAPEDLAIEDQPPAILSDDEAFSQEEASVMGPGSGKSDMAAIDEMLSDLSRPAALPDNEETPSGEDEQLTSVSYPPMNTGGTHLRERDRDYESELEALRVQLQEAQASVERERANAEKALANASSLPAASAGREGVAIKKELNLKDREILELKEKLTSKEKEILTLRDREAELEDQLVQGEEEKNAAVTAQSAADARVAAAERTRAASDEKASAAERARMAADEKTVAAEARTKEAEQRAKDAEKKVNVAENRQTTAEVKAKDAETRAKDADARLRKDTEDHKNALAELNRMLGDSNAREAELEGAVESATMEGKRLRDSLTETEKALTASRSANAQQNNEITRLTNALSGSTAEAENLREQLTMAQERGNAMDTELTMLRNDLESVRASHTELENEREVSEGRITRAYQKIRDDEKIKSKAKKAIEIALALLQEAGYSPDAEGPAISPTDSSDIDQPRS